MAGPSVVEQRRPSANSRATLDARVVQGTANRFVAGCSVIPTGGAVTPTLAIAALSLRLADHLTRTLKVS